VGVEANGVEAGMAEHAGDGDQVGAAADVHPPHFGADPHRRHPVRPRQNAVAVARELPRSRLLTLDGWGHVAFGKSGCIADNIDRYLVAGALPPPGTTCRPDQRPFG
jgi:TAP-like protein